MIHLYLRGRLSQRGTLFMRTLHINNEMLEVTHAQYAS